MSDAPEYNPPRVGSLLRFLRGQAGVSQAELDYLSGVDETTISDIETGTAARPWNSTLERLAAGLAQRMSWTTQEHLLSLLIEAKEHKPTEYRIAPELIILNDRIETYPRRTQRALLAFLRAQYDILEALITRINPPISPPEEKSSSEDGVSPE